MKLLKIGISGVRGIVGDSITPKLVMDFAAAFGTRVGGRPVLVGRDTRISGPLLHSAALAALISTGCDVLDLGVCPTPILQYMVPRLKAGGGVSITAGHNDIQWNALAFINEDGMALNPFQGAEVLDIYHLGKFDKVSTDRLGRIRDVALYADEYFDGLRAFLDGGRGPGRRTRPGKQAPGEWRANGSPLGGGAIAKARPKVVIDACNGAGAPFLEAMARALGFELIPVNHEPNGFFPHDPEPRPRNAQQVVAVIKAVGADAGFLLNSDVSRVSCVTETGESLSEEFTFPLVTAEYLKDRCGPVVTNLSTSRMVEDVARERGCPLLRTKVGQSYACGPRSDNPMPCRPSSRRKAYWPERAAAASPWPRFSPRSTDSRRWAISSRPWPSGAGRSPASPASSPAITSSRKRSTVRRRGSIPWSAKSRSSSAVKRSTRPTASGSRTRAAGSRCAHRPPSR